MLYYYIILFAFAAVDGKARIKDKGQTSSIRESPQNHSKDLRQYAPEISPSSENGFYFRKIPHLPWCKQLHWQRPPTKRVVAMATLQGSGSIWLRYLLQQATGIVTGSTDLDLALLSHGFPGENATDGSVLLVKTQLPPNHTSWCSAAVLLVRNPADAILADFNRRNAGFRNTAPVSAYKRGSHANPSHDWKQFAVNQIMEWETLNMAWLEDFTKPMIVVRYERLVRDTKATLMRILHFLGQNTTKKEMTCVMANREGLFRRYHRPENFDPFTVKMRRMMKKAQAKVNALITEYEQHHNYTTIEHNVEKIEDDLSETVELDRTRYRVFNDWKGVTIS